MAFSFREMSVSEQQEVNGGFAFSALIACVLLGAAASPAVVSVGVIIKEGVTAINNSFNDSRERAMKDAVNDARTDFRNGFRE